MVPQITMAPMYLKLCRINERKPNKPNVAQITLAPMNLKLHTGPMRLGAQAAPPQALELAKTCCSHAFFMTSRLGCAEPRSPSLEPCPCGLWPGPLHLSTWNSRKPVVRMRFHDFTPGRAGPRSSGRESCCCNGFHPQSR